MFSSDYDKLAYHLSRRDNISIETALLHVHNIANDGLSAEGVALRLHMSVEHAKRTNEEIPVEESATIDTTNDKEEEDGTGLSEPTDAVSRPRRKKRRKPITEE